MRKTLQFLFIALFFSIMVSGQNEIPNPNLESWDADTSFTQVIYWNPDHWSTPNDFVALLGQSDKLVVKYSTDAYSGDTCAMLESKVLQIFTFSLLAPGTLTLGTFEIDKVQFTGDVKGGIPFTLRPAKLKGYWKYNPQETDKGMAAIILTRWNAETSVRDTVGEGVLLAESEISDWTGFEVPVEYNLAGDPDTMNIVLMSSDFMDGFDGSLMYVDDLSLELFAGITYDLMPDFRVGIYPNPAGEIVIFELAEVPSDPVLKIFDSKGTIVGSVVPKEQKVECNISALESGTYYYELFIGMKRLNSGPFIVE